MVKGGKPTVTRSKSNGTKKTIKPIGKKRKIKRNNKAKKKLLKTVKPITGTQRVFGNTIKTRLKETQKRVNPVRYQITNQNPLDY